MWGVDKTMYATLSESCGVMLSAGWGYVLTMAQKGQSSSVEVIVRGDGKLRREANFRGQ